MKNPRALHPTGCSFWWRCENSFACLVNEHYYWDTWICLRKSWTASDDVGSWRYSRQLLQVAAWFMNPDYWPKCSRHPHIGAGPLFHWCGALFAPWADYSPPSSASQVSYYRVGVKSLDVPDSNASSNWDDDDYPDHGWVYEMTKMIIHVFMTNHVKVISPWPRKTVFNITQRATA